MGAPNSLQLWGTFPIFLPQDTSLPTCLSGCFPGSFCNKGHSFGSRWFQQLPEHCQKLGEVWNTRRERQSKGHISEAEGHTPLGGKTEPFKGGEFSPAKDLDAQISCYFLTPPARTGLWASHQNPGNGTAAAAPRSAWRVRNTKNATLTCF